MDEQTLENIVAALPTIGWATAMVIGLGLWILGRWMVRAGVAVSGLVIGALGGMGLGLVLADEGAVTIALVIGGAILGALIAALLFRFWMGLSAALMLGLTMPLAALVWQGTPDESDITEPDNGPPPSAQVEPDALAPDAGDNADDPDAADPDADPETDPEAAEAQREQRRQAIDQAAARLLEEFGLEELQQKWEASELDQLDPEDVEFEQGYWEQLDLEEVIEAARELALNWYEQQVEAVKAWWEDQGQEGRRTMLMAGLAGAVIGLVLGLVMPMHMASLQSAIVGSLLLIVAGRELAILYASPVAEWWPQSPRGLLLILAVLSVLSFVAQWLLFRKPASEK